MSDGFTADTARLAREAERFPEFAGRARAIHQALADALDAAGDCWGTDAAGRNFADSHVTAAADTLARLGALHDRLTVVGDRFAATARGYHQVEADTAGAFASQDE